MFADLYRGKRVLVTGHTGFKGSWLTTWLLKLGAKVSGVAIDIPTEPAMFDALGLAGRITHFAADVRDLNALRNIVEQVQPDFVFHLAAQAIVSVSFANPAATVSTNVIGTMNLLEVLRTWKRPCVTVLITSDKCYENIETNEGYRETDRLGGKDVYSASKAAAELIIHSYRYSFFPAGHPVRLLVGRAGNVIGGGDWAPDRIVADCMRAWSAGRPVEIRSPRATRPWQHVLEPLSGYLLLGQLGAKRAELHGQAYNFGPPAGQSHSVAALLGDLGRQWGFASDGLAFTVSREIPFHEAGLLALNCEKARADLAWEPTLAYPDTIAFISHWYKTFYAGDEDMYALTLAQIATYEVKLASRRARPGTAA